MVLGRSKGVICGTSWLSLRRYRGVWSVPWGWQGGCFCGTQSSFYPKLLGPKIDLVLVGGGEKLRGLGLGLCLSFRSDLSDVRSPCRGVVLSLGYDPDFN